MRWNRAWIPTQRHATNPERVLVYRKKMRVFWEHINRKLQAVTGLDDVMRIDLHQFCRYRKISINLTCGETGSLHEAICSCSLAT